MLEAHAEYQGEASQNQGWPPFHSPVFLKSSDLFAKPCSQVFPELLICEIRTCCGLRTLHFLPHLRFQRSECVRDHRAKILLLRQSILHFPLPYPPARFAQGRVWHHNHSLAFTVCADAPQKRSIGTTERKKRLTCFPT